jgi:hypothetical protein
MNLPTEFYFWVFLITGLLATTVIVTVIKATIYKQYGIPMYSAYSMYPIYPMYPVRL